MDLNQWVNGFTIPFLDRDLPLDWLPAKRRRNCTVCLSEVNTAETSFLWIFSI